MFKTLCSVLLLDSNAISSASWNVFMRLASMVCFMLRLFKPLVNVLNAIMSFDFVIASRPDSPMSVI